MTEQELAQKVARIKEQVLHQHKETKMAAKKNAAAAPTPVAPTPAPTAAEKPKKEVDPNAVALSEICKEIGITGQVARRKLRAAKLAKDGRWSWQKGSKELEQVKALLKPAPAAAAA